MTRIDDVRVLGLAAIYQQVILDEFGQWKDVLGRNPNRVRQAKYYKTFQRLFHILRKNKIRPEIYFRALSKWIKRSKRFPSLWPSLLTGATMLEIAKSYLRKQHLAHNRDRKAAGKAMRRSRLSEILSAVRQSCKVAEKVHKAYGLTATQILNSLSLSPYFLMTEEEYLKQLRNPTEEEKQAAKELSKRDDLLVGIIKAKKQFDYGQI